MKTRLLKWQRQHILNNQFWSLFQQQLCSFEKGILQNLFLNLQFGVYVIFLSKPDSCSQYLFGIINTKLSLPVIYREHIFLLISVVHMEHKVTVCLQRSLHFLGYYIVGPLVSLGSTCSVSQSWSKILKVP